VQTHDEKGHNRTAGRNHKYVVLSSISIRVIAECLTSAYEMRSTFPTTRTTPGGSVNKSELIEKVAGDAGLTKADAEKAVNAFIGAVQGAVASGDKVTLPGFGAWSRTDRAARTGRNPRTGEPVQIAAAKAVKFSTGADFKKRVNS
jgi:DNA-binding protein HU-beta